MENQDADLDEGSAGVAAAFGVAKEVSMGAGRVAELDEAGVAVSCQLCAR